jgi:hypothetical protein
MSQHQRMDWRHIHPWQGEGERRRGHQGMVIKSEGSNKTSLCFVSGASDDPLKTLFFPLDSMQQVPCVLTSHSGKEAVLENLTVTIKSTKSDDAHIPTHLWDNRVLAYAGIQELPREQVLKALGTLRDKFLLPLWKRIVVRNFRKWVLEMDKVGWWQEATERTTSLRAGAKALAYAVGATWWEWDHGSFPFFWRWTRNKGWNASKISPRSPSLHGQATPKRQSPFCQKGKE